MPARPNVDLVYLNAGGGHRASALALKAVIEAQGLPLNVRLVNLPEVLDPKAGFRSLVGIHPEDIYNARLARGWTIGLEHELKLLQGGPRVGAFMRGLESAGFDAAAYPGTRRNFCASSKASARESSTSSTGTGRTCSPTRTPSFSASRSVITSPSSGSAASRPLVSMIRRSFGSAANPWIVLLSLLCPFVKRTGTSRVASTDIAPGSRATSSRALSLVASVIHRITSLRMARSN